MRLLTQLRGNKELAEYWEEEYRLSRDAPDWIVEWSLEFGISIACFKCAEHDEWLVELDNLFPHHWEDCKCVKCVEQE